MAFSNISLQPIPMRNILFLSWIFFMPLCPIFLGSHISSVSGECLSNERVCLEDEMMLLLQLKSTLKFNAAASNKLLSWNQSADCCSWEGVVWDAGGHVVGLDLSREFISGGLNSSSSLFNLQHLQRLNLAYNNFNPSPISSGFGKLGNLIYLNLSSAGFSGQIPTEISLLTRLVTIDFSILYFPGDATLKLENPNLRMLVQKLSELRELYLNGVNLSAQGMEWCQALSSSVPNLQVLSLSNCHLSGPLDSSLQKLTSLSSIRLDSNNFSARVPDFLANFSSLTQLRLSSCGLHGKFPEKIFQVPTLRNLDLSNNKLLEGSFPEFPQNGSIETLVLFDTKFSGELPNTIGNLKSLTRIEIRNCDFSGAIPKSMADLTQLVYLDFSNNKFSGGIHSLNFSKGLTRLELSHNNLTGPISSLHWDGLVNLVVLDLRNNSLHGSLPTHLFSLPSLQKIQLSNNRFSGPLSEFSVAPSSVLDTLDLSSNNLEGPLPESVFDLHPLQILDLSSNRFNGTVELSRFQKLGNLTTLSLSCNNLSINASVAIPISPLPLNLTTLRLASCKLRTLPDLSSQSRLTHLDLSDNQINGSILSWIGNIGNGSLGYLNLSHNLLEDLQEPFFNVTPALSIIDLHSNKLRGQIPTPPFSSYVDYSNNMFNSSIPDDIGIYIFVTIFFSLSENYISGTIPESICNATYLQVLDFSDNNLSGEIPLCLIENGSLGVLNLQGNKFSGTISGRFPANCLLQTLDLNGNSLKGTIPRSLANCKALEVLNLGNNQMSDRFPCWLNNTTTLRVLVLRANNFHGPIRCPKSNSTWAMLQIVDLTHNNFSGKLPAKCFSTWTAMKAGENEVQSKLKHLQFRVLQFGQLYYQDAVTVTIKGQELELVKKVLTVFTSIDLSCNNLEGEIPQVIGNFTWLHALNLSHNGFTGQIPSSIGNMRQLESLDLSGNRLGGKIPTQLADLNFLSVLNLSFNELVGSIPAGNQLQTFSEKSYLGNGGLCGFPLNASCGYDTPPTSDIGRQSSSNRKEIKWEYIASEIGFVTGLGMVIWPLVLSRRWRAFYYKYVDRILLSRILNLQNQARACDGRRSHRTPRRRM